MIRIARTRTGRTLAGTVVTAVATLTATALLGVTPAGAAAATDGTPDTSFTAASGTGFDGSVNGLVVQSTAKIIAWGSFTQLNSAAVSGIARLTSAGAPDTAFTTALGTGFNNVIFAAAVHSNPAATATLDKVLVGGSFTTLNTVTVNRLARLNADGTPDTAFNTALGAGFNDAVRAILIQADGKIVVGGSFTQYQSTAVPYLARLNADGTLDTTFNTNLGTGPNAAVSELALQADGSILIGGSLTSLNSVAVGRLARLLSNGTPDAAFNTALGTGLDNEPYVITVQKDGKILVGGTFANFNGAAAAAQVLRLTSAGARDTAFDTPFGTGTNGAVWDVREQYDGEIVVAGSFSTINAVASRNVVRLNTNLSWDTGFATNQGTGFNDEVYALAFQSGGALVVGGYFDKLNEAAAGHVGRLLNNDPKPALPPSGANTGTLVLIGVLLVVGGLIVAQTTRVLRSSRRSAA